MLAPSSKPGFKILDSYGDSLELVSVEKGRVLVTINEDVSSDEPFEASVSLSANQLLALARALEEIAESLGPH